MTEPNTEPLTDATEATELPQGLIHAALECKGDHRPRYTGLAYSPLAGFALWVAKALSLVGAVASPLTAIHLGFPRLFYHGVQYGMLALYIFLGLLASLYHFALFVVFCRVQDRLTRVA